MKLEDLDTIENSLGIKLPANYRDWALSLPAADAETDWQYAYNDPSHIIEENKRLRSKGCQGENWPAELFCIGEADDNHYFIDLHMPDKVYYTNHDAGPYFAPTTWREDCKYKNAVEFYRRF